MVLRHDEVVQRLWEARPHNALPPLRQTKAKLAPLAKDSALRRVLQLITGVGELMSMQQNGQHDG